MRLTRIAAAGVFAVAMAGCSEQSTPSDTTSNDNNVSAAAYDAAQAEMKAKAAALGQPDPTVEPPASTSNWSYDTDRDEMRGTTTNYATISSTNTINLGFPYDPEKARLSIRKRAQDGTAVILQAPGQFLCRSYDDDTVAVKFDDGPIQHFSCSEPDAATTGVLFINAETRFLTRLKTAKRVIIEAQMFQAGPQQMTFEVAGLEWPPKAPPPT